MNKLSGIFGRIPGRGYLLLAVLIFAAANSVTRKLTELGAQFPVEGRNPISFCNVLFIGNLCALIALVAIYRRQVTPNQFSHLSQKDWMGVVGVAILSGALAPGLIFAALDQTAVNNVVLLGRIEPPLVLALSVILLHERVNLWVVLGAVISFMGVVLTVVLQPPEDAMIQMAGFSIGRGELLAIGGAIASAIANILSKLTLQDIPLGLFNIIRTAIATPIFFVAAIALFGTDHFADAFSPLLWQWMILYGAVIVVGGQLAWFAGLKHTNASEVSLMSSFNPVAGVLAAYLILGEAPTIAHYVGGAVILVGIALNQIGVSKQPTPPEPVYHATSECDLEAKVGFRGI
ncbi:MAG: DMT family transporter [Elainellaceae cyanobacterium]